MLALAANARTAHIPVATPNCFPAAEREKAQDGPRDPRPEGIVSFHWFSQTLGPGRGLETLALALPRLRGDWHLCLRGALRSHREWFEGTFDEASRARIHLADPVPNAELLARTMSHDVGLALEEPTCPSRNLTATNKLFEYFRAGLAVIATRTRGQEEVMDRCPGAGILVPPGDAPALARAMQVFLDDPARLDHCRQTALRAGGETWSWEQHVAALLDTFSEVIAHRVG